MRRDGAARRRSDRTDSRRARPGPGPVRPGRGAEFREADGAPARESAGDHRGGEWQLSITLAL